MTMTNSYGWRHSRGFAVHPIATLICGLTATAGAYGQESTIPAASLQEIVVTAQKRSEDLQEVPISMSAVTSDQLVLLNGTRLTDVMALVPSMQVESQSGDPGSANITLRGISTASTSSTTTATTIDDVPIGSSSNYVGAALMGTELTPYDLDHVEVLEGPQGTLYGAASLGGLLKYVTPTPNLDEISFRVGGALSSIDHPGSSLGNTERAAVNVPVIPGELAVNASAGRTYSPGYVDNVANGARAFNDGTQDSARVTALWQPTEGFSAKIMALYSHSDFSGYGTVKFDPNTNLAPLGYTSNFFRNPSSDYRRESLYDVTLNYQLGWATLTSISAYSEYRGAVTYDGNAVPFFASFTDLLPGNASFYVNKSSEELRLVSADSRPLRWMVGLFYTHEGGTYTEDIFAFDPVTKQVDPALNPLELTVTPSSFIERAVFANTTYNFTSNWDGSVGARYSQNAQTFQSYGAGQYFYGTNPPPTLTSTGSVSGSATTYSVDSRYHLTPTAMIYGRIATGYRAGGSNGPTPGDPAAPTNFGPDKVTNYEIGLKSKLDNNRALVNLAVFYIDWTNIQVENHDVEGSTFVDNSGKAVSKGVELTTAYSFAATFLLSLNAAYTDARILTTNPVIGSTAGDPLPYSPKLAGNIAAEWKHQLSASYEGNIRAAERYVGARQTNFLDNTLRDAHLPSYTALDLSAGVSTQHWRVNMFVKNAANNQAFLSYNFYGAAILPPRTIGVGFDYQH